MLIVEDQVLFAELLLLSLHPLDWVEVVGCAMNGRDGIVLATVTRPDVVLMDIEMPVLDGIQATRAILARMSTEIIMISGSTGSEKHRQAIAAGARAVFPKAFDPERLIGEIAKIREGAEDGPSAAEPSVHVALRAGFH